MMVVILAAVSSFIDRVPLPFSPSVIIASTPTEQCICGRSGAAFPEFNALPQSVNAISLA
jgi:hypothetical protein